MSIAAIIPARGGSKRIPRKAIREFKGQPMMAWPIAAAQSSMLFDAIIVTTDDDEIAALARSLHCDVFRRLPDDGTRGTQAVAAEVLDDLHCDLACVIYPCSPMLRATELQIAYAVLRDSPHFMYAMSVLTDPLADAGMFYFGRRAGFVNDAPLVYWHTAMVPIHPSRGIDINTEEDWLRAESMFDRLHEGGAA